ncbi:MAG: vWA domain-containing protein [Myxococcota bacterium]
MFKFSSVLAWLTVAGLGITALTAGCGLTSDGDDDAGSKGGSTGSGNGGAQVGFGGASQGNGGNTGISFGGSNASGGFGSGAANGFDGGILPITPDQKKLITESACAGFLTEGETLPSVLQLVVDTSSSMSNRAPGSNNLSKWDVTRDALLDAIVGVNGSGLPASVAVGMIFYPNVEYQVSTTPKPLETCVNTGAAVPIELLGPRGAPHRTRIGDAIQQVRLAQSTPTDDAYTYALENQLLPSTAIGKKFMLLITDGTPTLLKDCMNPTGQLSDVDPTPIVEEITVAAREGINTFLIGSPGSEANRTWMSRAAAIGGTAIAGCNINGPNYCHMDMTTEPDFAAALKAGLARVVGQITPCTFTFADPPAGQMIDANNINVVINSAGQSSLVVRDDMGTCTQGWQLTPDKEILLCPDTCAQIKSDSGASVDVVFGCNSFTEVPIK